MDKQSLLKRYNSHLIALERRAPLTAQTYRFEISRFLDWRFALGTTMSLADVTKYLEYRRGVDGIDSRSVAKAISALRSFFRFLDDNGEKGYADLAALLQAPRRADRLPAVHRRQDVEELLSKIKTDTPRGIRDRALYELLYSAGLRISEAVSLNVEGLFLSRCMARVTGKGNKERLVIFGPEAAHWLGRYMTEARPVLLGKRSSKAVFVSKSGKRLSRKGMWKNYSALATEIGLSSKLHTLRHTFATELLTGGADLRSVQELMGHADIATTQIYTHVSSSHLRENHRKYLPKLKSRSAP